MREPDLVFEFQTHHPRLWTVMGWSRRRIPCKGCGRAMEVRAVPKPATGLDWIHPSGQLFIDEAADPQVTVNGIIDWLEELP